MANKNQIRLKQAARKANKTGNEYAVEVPSRNFHNSEKGQWQIRRFPSVKYAVKKKAKPFPVVGQPMTLAQQRQMYYGASFKG